MSSLNKIKQLNPFARYQKGLTIQDLFPIRSDDKCACGCDKVVLGKNNRWSTKKCKHKALIQFYIIKGDTEVIRELLFRKDKGACRNCSEITDTWEADHIVPVYYGGGGCGMKNYQTLCKDCHKEKTINMHSKEPSPSLQLQLDSLVV